MTWYEELDFDENPFSTNPKHHSDKLIDMDAHVNELYYRIDSSNMLVIEGGPGTGKTTLLIKAIEKYGGKRKIIYVDCAKLGKDLDIRDLLIKGGGLAGTLFNKKPKDMILLLDNVQNLSKQNNERIKFYFDQNYLRSVIFTCESYSRVKFSDSIRDRIGDRIIRIGNLTQDMAIKMIMARIGSTELFNDKLIKKLYRLSRRNPKVLLELCEKSTIAALEKGRNRVQQIDIEQVIGNDLVQ